MTAGDLVIEGRALIGEELLVRDVALVIERGIIRKIEEIPNQLSPWICPALFNAHTHVGDSIAMDLPFEGNLEELVTPPDGLKHRILAGTPDHELVSAMRATIAVMERGGIGGFADFREGGIQGVHLLHQAADGFSCRPLILGRDGGEFAGDGVGISSARDVSLLEKVVSCSRESGKLVAFHAGEKDRFDIDAALSYEPDLMVHCTYATRKQLKRCADAGIQIAVCPRSNWMLGVIENARRPPVREMLDLGCRISLGTDNCMVVQPDLWREMSFLSTVYRLPARQILQAAVEGSRLRNRTFFIEEGAPANFLVIDPGDSNLWLSHDPMQTLVSRAGIVNILTKVINS
ncbi:MAG: amidohydrolase family protein [Methanoregulaceae archaeon]|nr:amidohydrolase family protein [Methanoregulaceae archaeon]